MITATRPNVLMDITPILTSSPDNPWSYDRRRTSTGPSEEVDGPVGQGLVDDLAASLTQLSVRHDADQQALWCAFEHPVRPCFTPDLLREITCFQQRLERMHQAAPSPSRVPFASLVWHSSFPDVWNLGGDLELFVRLITAGEREALRAYAHRCVDTVWRNWTKGGARFETIALVEGDALGGGFEAALSNDVIVAERHSKFGLPEILFRMFPGMGAYSFLSRRIGGAEAQAMITSGRLYSADEMAERGVVDVVVESGQGRAAVGEWLSVHRHRRNVLDSLALVRRRCQPIAYEELIDVTDIWVDTAFALERSDLRRMERLAKAQDRRRAREISRAAA